MSALLLSVLMAILGIVAGIVSRMSKEAKEELFWLLMNAVLMTAIAVCTLIAYVSIKGIA